MKYVTPILTTERLILKRGILDDYKKVYEYDFTRLRNIDGEFEYVKYDSEKLKGFETYADEEDNVLDFIVYLKDTNEPIENIIFDRYDEKIKSLEISLNLHPKYWRKGYMTEALLSTIRYVFENFDIDNVIYGYVKEYFKSKGLSGKIGFEFYSENIEHYTRLNKDIKEKNILYQKKNCMIPFLKENKL